MLYIHIYFNFPSSSPPYSIQTFILPTNLDLNEKTPLGLPVQANKTVANTTSSPKTCFKNWSVNRHSSNTLNSRGIITGRVSMRSRTWRGREGCVFWTLRWRSVSALPSSIHPSIQLSFLIPSFPSLNPTNTQNPAFAQRDEPNWMNEKLGSQTNPIHLPHFTTLLIPRPTVFRNSRRQAPKARHRGWRLSKKETGASKAWIGLRSTGSQPAWDGHREWWSGKGL